MITHRSSNSAGQIVDCLLGHWLLVAGMILVAAALTIPQVDRLAFGSDERHSFRQALGFGLTGKSYSPADVLESIAPNDQPLSELLLHFWAYAVGHSLAGARLPFVYTGLLSLAFVYRLVSDSVHPIAGTIAAFLVLCLAKYSLYWAHARHYTMVVLFAALVLWLYLRIINPRVQPRRRDFIALVLASCANIMTFAFGTIVLVTISLYHVIATKKDRRWLQVVTAGAAALILISPLLYRMLTDGLEAAFRDHGAKAQPFNEILSPWLLVFSNGSVWLLALAALGAFVGWRRGAWRDNPFILLLLLLGVSIALLSEVSGVISSEQMRYLLPGTPIVAGFVASGFYALYRQRRWLGLLAALLWMVAGMHYLVSADWRTIAPERVASHTRPPWHLVSRWMRQADENLLGMAFAVDHSVLDRYTGLLRNHYFGQYSMQMQNRSALDIDGRISANALEQPGYYILFQHGVTEPTDMAIVRATLDKYGYEACTEYAIPNNVVIYTYRWKSLHCDAQPKATFATDAGDYLHYGAHYEGGKLLFTSAWQPAITADPDTHNISFQLLDADWRNHGQIDLPTSSLSEMRQLIFELSDLPAGDYRLMVVVYDAQTGERQVWQANEDWIPEMQQLAEMIVSVRDDNTP